MMNQRCYGIILWVLVNTVKGMQVGRTGTGWGRPGKSDRGHGQSGQGAQD